MPLATALFLGRPGPASLLLAAAALTAFASHEPLLVVLGRRGSRALEVNGHRARVLLAWLPLAAGALGAAGVSLGPAATRWSALVPVALAGLVGVHVWLQTEKSLAGELSVAAALSSCGLPVAVAGGVAPAWATTCWIVWLLAFTAATVAVRAILERTRSRGAQDPGHAAATVPLALLVAVWIGASRSLFPHAAAIALTPMAGLSLALCLSRVSAHRLRQVGWAIVGASLVTLVAMVAGFR